MSRRSLSHAFSSLLVGLSLCAGMPMALAQDAPVATEPVVKDEPAVKDARISQALLGQTVYLVLLSEIAAARGQTDIAVQGYLDLTQKTRDARVARRATEIAVMGKRMPEALEAARLWAEIDPQSEEATQYLGGLLASGQGKPDDLENLLSGLLARHAKAPGSMLMGLNRTFSRYSDKSDVQHRIERLTAPYVGFAEAHFARAYAAFNAEDVAGALAATDKALALRPEFESAALLKMQVLQKAGRTKEAIAFANDFVGKQPKLLEARYAYARLLAIDKQYALARGEFEKLVKDVPASGEFGFTYALLLVQAGEAKAAEAEFKRLLEIGQPDPDTVKMQLGQLYEEGKRVDEAIAVYRSIGPGAMQTNAVGRMAMLQAKKGDVAVARAELQKLRESRPKEVVGIYLAEAQMLRDLKRVPEAMALLEGALIKQPEQTELLYEYAMLAERAGKIEVMERSLRKIIGLKPDEAQAYNALGYVLADRNERLDEAQSLLDKAIALSPDDAFIQDSLGWVLFRKGNLPGAYDYLKRAHAARPDPEIAAHLGEVLWTMGRKDEARKTWDDAHKLSPDNEELAKVMKRFAQ